MTDMEKKADMEKKEQFLPANSIAFLKGAITINITETKTVVVPMDDCLQKHDVLYGL